jgi:hypothetical protein
VIICTIGFLQQYVIQYVFTNFQEGISVENKGKILLRCIAYKGENAGKVGYYAYCIDLSLSTWRPTLQTAKASLHDAICGYVETVVENASQEELSDERQFRRLILRKAPVFPYQAMYFFSKYITKILRKIAPKEKVLSNARVFENPIDQNNYCTSPA